MCIFVRMFPFNVIYRFEEMLKMDELCLCRKDLYWAFRIFDVLRATSPTSLQFFWRGFF